MKKIRLNMIVSKRHIILSALVLSLSIAVYLNWQYVQSNGTDLIATENIAASAAAGEELDGEVTETAAYGEAYFAEAKLSRSKSRDEAMDALKYMLEDADLSDEDMASLTTRAADLAESIEKEGKIENLIKAKGFADCMVYLEEDKIDVLVKCDGMTDSEAAQIKDAILGEVTLPDEKISIIEIK